MSTGRVIAAKCLEDDIVSWHAEGPPGAYHTLCGLSLDDDMFERVLLISRKQKINCVACRGIWELAKTFRRPQFT